MNNDSFWGYVVIGIFAFVALIIISIITAAEKHMCMTDCHYHGHTTGWSAGDHCVCADAQETP